MSETPNIKENPFEQANGNSGKENLPFNRKKKLQQAQAGAAV